MVGRYDCGMRRWAVCGGGGGLPLECAEQFLFRLPVCPIDANGCTDGAGTFSGPESEVPWLLAGMVVAGMADGRAVVSPAQTGDQAVREPVAQVAGHCAPARPAGVRDHAIHEKVPANPEPLAG